MRIGIIGAGSIGGTSIRPRRRSRKPACGGDHAMGVLLSRLADSLRQHGCANVTVEVIKDSGHRVVDEQPDSVAELIERHASRSRILPSK